jgi:hypothetical protein
MIKTSRGFALPVSPIVTGSKCSMRRNPLKKVLYNYTSHPVVSSSLTFEVPLLKALRPQGQTLFGKMQVT